MAGASKPRSRRRRWLLITLAALPILLLGLWVAIHRIPGFGSMLADAGRAVVGNDAIAWLEETAYAAEDRWNRASRDDEKPVAYWDVPPTPSGVPSEVPAGGVATGTQPAGTAPARRAATYVPANVPPMFEKWAAPGDGTWLPILDPRRPEDGARMYKTLLHPDPKRAWAAVAIVAMELATLEVHLVIGRHEPKTTVREPAAEGYVRRAVIPEEHRGALLAAWNGGYKSTHGNFGIRVDGITIARPLDDVCTVAGYADGTIAVRTWKHIASTEESMKWWRQTPACMVEQGKMHGGLTVDGSSYWGATLDGDTIIRRSAIGRSADGKTLFVAIGDATAARAIARALQHVGAEDVAQLDVNWSFPKFLLYEPKEPGSAELVAKPLAKGFEYSDDEYLGTRAQRDFFYVTRRGP